VHNKAFPRDFIGSMLADRFLTVNSFQKLFISPLTAHDKLIMMMAV